MGVFVAIGVSIADTCGGVVFKRLTYLGIGAAAGAAGTVWSQRKVREKVERAAEMATPRAIADAARGRIVDVRDNVVAAVDEGRGEKRRREAELRHRVEQRWRRRAVGEPSDRL
ncbi:MAG: hypothetical protein R2698_13545 [Microthrixaceae bacterium]